MERYGRPSPRQYQARPLSIVKKKDVASIQISGRSMNQEDGETKKVLQRPKSGIRRTSTGIIDRAAMLRPSTATSIRKVVAVEVESSPVAEEEMIRGFEIEPPTSSFVPRLRGLAKETSVELKMTETHLEQLKNDVRVVQNCIYNIYNKTNATNSIPQHISQQLNRYVASNDLDQCFKSRERLERLLEYSLSELLLLGIPEATAARNPMVHASSDQIRRGLDQIKTLSRTIKPFIEVLRHVQMIRERLVETKCEAELGQKALKEKQHELEVVRGHMLLLKDTLSSKIREKTFGLSSEQKFLLKNLIETAQDSQDSKVLRQRVESLEKALDEMETVQATAKELEEEVQKLKVTCEKEKEERVKEMLKGQEWQSKAEELKLQLEKTRENEIELRQELETQCLNVQNRQERLERLEKQETQAVKRADGLENRVESVNEKLANLQVILKQSNEQNSRLESNLARVNTERSQMSAELSLLNGKMTNVSQELYLTQTELTQVQSKWQETLIQLEAAEKRTGDSTKLASDVTALKSSLQETEQKFIALEKTHDLETSHLVLQVEREKEIAQHAIAQAETVSQELETANLCLAERRRQRDADRQAFEQREKELSVSNAELRQQLGAVEAASDSIIFLKMDTLRQELKQEKEKGSEYQVEREKRIEQVEDLRKQLKEAAVENAKLQSITQATSEADAIKSKKLIELSNQLEVASTRISELEIQHKSFLETQETTGANNRALLHSKKRKLAADTKKLTKQMKILEQDREKLNSDRNKLQEGKRRHEKSVSQLRERENLMKQVVQLMNARLSIQMGLLKLIHVADSKKKKKKDENRKLERMDGLTELEWQALQRQWADLHEKLDDADWQLIHMKQLIEEFDTLPKQRSSSPFSDAIAAGESTLKVADELRESDERDEDDTGPTLAEQETFIAALQEEMHSMKESYEAQLEESKQDFRKLRSKHMSHDSRQRKVMEEQRKAFHTQIEQLNGKCVELERALTETNSILVSNQEDEIQILEKYKAERDPVTRDALLQHLFSLREKIAQREIARRSDAEIRRLRKLTASCGASSVSNTERQEEMLQ